MKILVVGSRIPWPLKDGGAIATYQMLKGLSAQGADIVYFSFNTRKHHVAPAQIAEHFNFCRVIDVPLDANPTLWGALKAILQGKNYNISRFESEKANEVLKDLLRSEKFDWVQLEGLYASPFLETIREAGLPVSLRQHNAEFQIWKRLASGNSNGLKKLYFNLLASQLERYEKRMLNAVDAIIPIAPSDKIIFEKIAPGKPMYLLPVGQERVTQNAGSFNKNSFFHLGSMEWMPNIEAVKWLVEKVWPGVRSKLPLAELHLAGKGLQKNDPDFMGEGIHVHGEISDAHAFIQSHGIMVVPVFAGGGIRVKILEAFNLGAPVISTDIGIQGIDAHSEEELLLANTPKEFAGAMVRLQTDAGLREKLIRNAGLLIENRYEIQTIMSGLLKFYQDMRNKI
jgi:glycosyltransferase involved in cell wall biosynthesis